MASPNAKILFLVTADAMFSRKFNRIILENTFWARDRLHTCMSIL